jgi:uncharacterized protein (TIGR00730 family)
MNRLTVFCGSNTGSDPAYVREAEKLAALLVSQGIDLVYGGGNVGLMGRIADAVLAGGGKVIGVIPERLVAKEVAHSGLTELIVVGSMHSSKTWSTPNS